MNNYIFKLKNGYTYHFYYEKANKLQFKKLLSDNTWSKPSSLLTDTTESISMVADFNDSFHIIYQNTSGSIIYSIFDTSNLKIYEMLKSRTNEVYERYFKTVHCGNLIHFFYVLKKDDIYSIIHQQLQNSEFSMPKILGTISTSPINYQVIADSIGNLHLFYLSSENIIYKKFIMETNNWQDLPNVDCGGKVINNLSCCINKNSSIFIAYQRVEADKSISLIIKHLKNRERSFDEYNLHKYNQAHKYIEISPILDDLIFCYFDASNYYISYIEKFKFIWDQAKKVALSNLKIAQYTSYYPYENISIASTPFSNLNGLSLPLINKLNLEAIHKKMLDEEILTLKNRMNNIEKVLFERNNDLEKLIIKVKFLENRR